MKVKEESKKVGLKLNIQKTKIMASSPITSWEIDEETMETVSDFIFWGSKITADGDCSHEIKRRLLLGRKVMTNLDSTFKLTSLSQWCHPDISSSVVPFSSCLQSLPASECFAMSQLFAWGGQSTGASALASFRPKKSQGWSPSEWTGWISLQSKGLSRVFSNTTLQKHSILQRSAFFTVQLSHPYMTTGKTIALTKRTFVGKVMSLLLICYLGWS